MAMGLTYVMLSSTPWALGRCPHRGNNTLDVTARWRWKDWMVWITPRACKILCLQMSCRHCLFLYIHLQIF